MGRTLKQLGFATIEEAKQRLKFKSCKIVEIISWVVPDKQIRCAVSNNCPFDPQRCNLQEDCFKSCRLNRRKKDGR